MLLFKKNNRKLTYDKTRLRPVLRKSICTGEVTAGFREKEGRAFHEVMLIRDEKDLESFMKLYGIEEKPETEY